jgi:shikimate kinase/3-dehydroquinate synthase
MAGFAAATFLRGVAFVQVPTSLLAMVDSSVGGKVGVDLPQGKNLIGAFKQPELVVADTDALRTLPDIEWRCGLAEVIKAGLIRDPALLGADLTRTNASVLIARAVAIKAAVVEADPYESGIRAYLNLGHTFGHALEQVSGYRIKHGEAVAIGLAAAARLSHLHGLCDAALPALVERLANSVGLPVSCGAYPPEAVQAAMATDKKRAAGKVRFVLLRAPGDPLLADDVPDQLVLEVLKSLQG